MSVNFNNKVAVITGAGGGLGRSYALLLGSLGAKVVVNDLGTGLKGENNSHDTGKRPADLVVEEIRRRGGVAVANYDSVEFGAKIIETAIQNFGRVDILINNAGILRDVSFQKMTEKEWDMIMQVHLKGAFSCTKAAWKYMQQQKYGRIVNTASAAGLYGNFGQVNYSAAKIALVGFTKSLGLEGAKYNIKVNCIAPLAGTRMTETVMPKEIVDALKPEYVAPVVAYLASDTCNDTGEVFEVGAGWVSNVRWQRTEGVLFPLPFTADDVKNGWQKVTDFRNPSYPTSLQDSMMMVTQRLSEFSAGGNESGGGGGGRRSRGGSSSPPSPVEKAERIFDLMAGYLQKRGDTDGKKLVQKTNSVFHFDILPAKNSAPIGSWTIDLKSGTGRVCKGKEGSASATFSMVAEDFASVCLGKLNPQTAFIQGKMKIKGDMRAATKFTPDLFPKITEEILHMDTQDALQSYLNQNVSMSTGMSRQSSSSSSSSPSSSPPPSSSGKWSDAARKLKSSPVLAFIEQFLSSDQAKHLPSKVGHVYRFDILPDKKQPPVSFTFDLKSSPAKLTEGAAGKPDTTFIMLDEDFMKLASGKLNPQRAFLESKMKIKGSMSAAMKFKPDLFPKMSSL